MARQTNTDFLLNLLLESGNTVNIAEFITGADPRSNRSCICVSRSIGEKFTDIRSSFENNDQFLATYFDCYMQGLENYSSIVGENIREIFFDQADATDPTTFEQTSLQDS